jgi:hypothetical protein
MQMSETPPLDVWVTTSPLLDGAVYVRQGIWPAHTGAVLTRAFQISALIERRPDLLDGGSAEPRAGFEHIRLLHVRTQRLLTTAEATLEQQGVAAGDVLAVINAQDADSIEPLAALARSQGFPESWSPDIPRDVTRASGTELRELEERMKHSETVTTTYNVQIGSHAVITNSFVAANTIQDSFNSFHQSDLSPELRDELSRLHQAIPQLLAAIKSTPEESDLVAGELKALTQEALSSDHRRPLFMRRAADALLHFAERAGEVGTPVVGLVSSIVRLLGV